MSALRIVPLGDLTAILDRRSGATHLLASPAPEILDMLADAPLTLDALAARIDGEVDREALAARIGELVAAGLVERA